MNYTKILVPLIIFLNFTIGLSGQIFERLPPAELYDNVFMIKTDTSFGSSFKIDHNDKEYLITAKHLFKKGIENNSETKIELLINNKYVTFIGKVRFNEKSDIIVLALNKGLNVPFNPVGLDQQFTPLGQDLYFMGFPSFNKMAFYTDDGNVEHIYPLIKKAIFSGGIKVNEEITIDFLDGINNPGFSGGPVVGYDMKAKKVVLVGVISAFYIDNLQNELDLRIASNSGIIKSYSSREIKLLIDKLR